MASKTKLWLAPASCRVGSVTSVSFSKFKLVGSDYLNVALVGALTVGRISDILVVEWREKRRGKWYPEDRLRAAIPGALVIAPLSVFLSGLFVTYVPGKLGIALNLVCLFLNGVGASFFP
jgi:hypothetical protein